MTNWTLPVIMGLIGIFIAGEARTARQVNSTMTANALSLGVAYFLAAYLVEDFAAASAFGIAMLYLLPASAAALLALLLARDVSPALPKPMARLVERTVDATSGFAEHVASHGLRRGARQ